MCMTCYAVNNSPRAFTALVAEAKQVLDDLGAAERKLYTDMISGPGPEHNNIELYHVLSDWNLDDNSLTAALARAMDPELVTDHRIAYYHLAATLLEMTVGERYTLMAWWEEGITPTDSENEAMIVLANAKRAADAAVAFL